MDIYSKSCPCFKCICVATCKTAKSTHDILVKCHLIKKFYQTSHPFHSYQSFIAIRKCLGFKYQDKKTYDKMYKDWQDLINRKDYSDHFHTNSQEDLYYC